MARAAQFVMLSFVACMVLNPVLQGYVLVSEGENAPRKEIKSLTVSVLIFTDNL